MDALTLSRLGVKHTKSAIAESLRINTGYDVTSPVTFYGIVNERCNVKCRQCEYWRLKEYKDEILCDEFPVIGNVKEQSAREIWYDQKAQEVRRDTLNFGKLCLITCVSQKTVLDKVKMGMKLLKN
jgi:MoaA/NifB/PqqE/SkfB family radical SAM enzyme